MPICIYQLSPSVFGDGTIIVMPDFVGPAVTPYARTALRNNATKYFASTPGHGAYDPDRRWGGTKRLAAADGLNSSKMIVKKTSPDQAGLLLYA